MLETLNKNLRFAIMFLWDLVAFLYLFHFLHRFSRYFPPTLFPASFLSLRLQRYFSSMASGANLSLLTLISEASVIAKSSQMYDERNDF